MGKNTKIEWATYTFNPWVGCTKVSLGCKNCYAEALMDKRFKRAAWGPQGTRVIASESYWRQLQKWNREAEKGGARRRVFCASLADVFEGRDTMPEDQYPAVELARERLFNLIRQTPRLDWLLLTKRPENVMGAVPLSWVTGQWPLNAWIGTSVEDQATANGRIPALLDIPTPVRFLSCEPLLGPVDFSRVPAFIVAGGFNSIKDFWVIVGGESGPGKRPFNPDWARFLRDQCRNARVPFFMKQWDKVQHIPDDLMIREFPRVTAREGKQ